MISFLNILNENDNLLLNLSGNNKNVLTSLLYTSTFAQILTNINFKWIIILEDQNFQIFNLLPKYIPNKIDIKILYNISSNLTLTELGKKIGRKQSTVSTRLKTLSEYGYILINGRNRELTNLGKLIIKFYNSRKIRN